jgi:hypothetical protein
MNVAKESSDTPAARYYVTHDREVRGPFDLGLIEAMVLSGIFPPNVSVCKVGSHDWSPLSPALSKPACVPASTAKRPSQSSRLGGSKRGFAVVVGVIVTLFAVRALLNNPSKSETQQNGDQSALTYQSSPTPQPIAPTFTPPVAKTYRDAAGTTYRVPQWANQGLVAKKSALDAQEASLNSLRSQVEALGNQIESKRTYVDRRNQYVVDEFNREVDRYNSLNQQLKDGVDAFNASVKDCNAELARVGTLID